MNLQKIHAAVVPGGIAIVLFLSAGSGLAAESDDAPLVLSNESVGMSLEELRPDAGQPPVIVEAPSEVAAPSAAEIEAVTERAKQRIAEAKPQPPVAVLAAAPEGGPAVTYELCMERAIRAGVAYETSNQVCRAVFGSLW